MARSIAAVAAWHVGDGTTAVVFVGDAPFIVDQRAVDESAHHSPVERMSLEWAPIAFGENVVGSQRPRAVALHEYEVGHVAFA